MLGPYCATCGQKNEPEHRSLWQLVKDAVGPAVLLEGKLWRTLGTLLGRPGTLSQAYAEGKRSRYIRPLRLYLWVSVLFFGILTLRPMRPPTILAVEGNEHISIPFLPDLSQKLESKLERFKRPAPEPGKPPFGGEPTTQELRLRDEFVARVPKAAILMVPVFAALLRLLWWKRPYVEQLVFALHAHTVLFLGLMLRATRVRPLWVPALVAVVVWFFVAVRRFYGSAWWAVVLKTLVLGVAYTVVLMITIVLTMMVSLLAT